jgi:diacylglycerol kinase family enzyme
MTATDPTSAPVTGSETSVDLRRRLAAVLALLALAASLVVVVVALEGQVWRVVAGMALLLVVTVAGWYTVTRRGGLRVAGIAGAVGGLALFLVLVLTGDAHGLLVLVVLALAGTSVGLTRYALRRDRRSIRQVRAPGTAVGPARHPVLIMNPKSGGGKATRYALADEARRRGIEPLVLEPGSDLLQLARNAIDRGADVLGMAGGDGSQALVASVAMAHDVALVCIPAGTRNHFALDLGLDRDDVVGALDAFGEALERRIDLGEVGGRIFVNNVSLGVYAKIVQSPEYRDAKRQTTTALLPDLLGPEADSFGMRFTDVNGTTHERAQLIQVSNNPYVLTRIGGFGTRARLDTGTLGVAAVEVRGSADVAQLVAAETAGRVQRFRGWTEFATPEFTVDADGPVEAGVDGEALLLDPPLVFRCLPGAVRIRIPTHAPGWSPAALVAPSKWWTLTALVRTVAGRPTPIDEPQR